MGDIKLEDIEDNIEEIFNSKIYNKKKVKNHLYIYADKEKNTLSFKLPSSGILHTGIGGFLNYIKTPWIINFDKIFLNGLELNTELTKEFWKWIDNIKEIYEDKK